jgi:thioesterase domain-containing protein/acyl carrier protein
MSLADTAAENSNETEIARLFAEAFELPSVNLEDDFFQLGGDSLIGQSLMTAIEERFGVSLSLSVLLEAPTPRSLAGVIAERRRASARGNVRPRDLPPHLIAINRTGAPPPMFLVHGNTGESVAPQQLSEAFAGRSFFAFRAPGLEQGEGFLNTMDAFASNYLSVIHRLYPKDPIVLLGHCAGATIAYEMAQRIAAKRRGSVALVLIDPEIDAEHAPFLSNSGLQLKMLQSLWQKRIAHLDDAMRKNPAVRLDRRREFVVSCINAAIGPYIPKPYAGPTLLLHTDERRDILLNPDRGYPSFATNLEAVRLSVPHVDMFTAGAKEVGAAVNSFVQRAIHAK